MSVVEALNGHAVHEFERYFRDLIASAGFPTLDAYARRLGMKNSANIYHILKVRSGLKRPMAERLIVPLGVSAEEFMAKYPLKGKLKPPRRSHGRVVVTPITDLEPTPVRTRREVASTPERFFMSVNADGTAAVRLDIPDLPLDVALRLVQALELPGLLGSRLCITHTTDEEKPT